MTVSKLAKKLLIKPGQRIAVVNAPPGFEQMLRPLQSDVTLVRDLAPNSTFIILFVKNVSELQKLGSRAVRALEPDAMFWVAYPKKSSKAASDISRDVGWDIIEAAGLEGVALVAIDETWSASRFRPKELIGKRRSA
jgi:hypothetical protein